MESKKYGIILIAAPVFFCMAGCNKIENATPYLDDQASIFTTTETTAALTTQTTSTTVTTKLTGPEFTQIPLELPDESYEETELIYQAEEEELTEIFETLNEKTDYTGTGYVSGLRGDLQNEFAFNTEIPASQRYDVSVVVCADYGAECSVFVNDEKIDDISVESSDRFVSVTIPGIYMEAGGNTVLVRQNEGDMLIDCLEIRNTSLEPDTFASAEPVNEDSSDKTRELLKFFSDNYGKAIISGQQVSDSSNKEIERIVKTTGKYPLIRFADMYPYSLNGGSREYDDTVEAALKWSKDGGVTGLMWHWFAPLGTDGTLEKSEDFSLSSAVTFEDIACLTPKALEELQKTGDISKECVKLIEDIDSVSEGLKELRDAGIPVLWRPLHQAGNNMYWWDSEGRDVYLWLWNLLYERMTEYHGLNNLLWIWSGVDAEYLPDSSRYDIAAADIYLTEDEEMGSGYESYYALQKMSEGKLIALSECSSPVDVNKAFRDGSVWLYFGLWYEPYLESEDNEFVDSETLINVYNSEGVLTREDYAG